MSSSSVHTRNACILPSASKTVVPEYAVNVSGSSNDVTMSDVTAGVIVTRPVCGIELAVPSSLVKISFSLGQITSRRSTPDGTEAVKASPKVNYHAMRKYVLVPVAIVSPEYCVLICTFTAAPAGMV